MVDGEGMTMAGGTRDSFGMWRRLPRRGALRAGLLGAGGAAFALACGGSSSKSDDSGKTSSGLSTGSGAVVVTATPKAEEQARRGGGITVSRTTKFLEHDMHTALAGTVWHLIGNRAVVLDNWKGELQSQLAE